MRSVLESCVRGLAVSRWGYFEAADRIERARSVEDEEKLGVPQVGLCGFGDHAVVVADEDTPVREIEERSWLHSSLMVVHDGEIAEHRFQVPCAPLTLRGRWGLWIELDRGRCDPLRQSAPVACRLAFNVSINFVATRLPWPQSNNCFAPYLALAWVSTKTLV